MSFTFKQFHISDERCGLKVGTDGVLLGAAMSIPEGGHFLDIGTGSGVIALMAAQRCPEAFITAIDIDAGSCKDAQENFAASPWPDRLEVIETSLEEFSKSSPEVQLDHIFSNPPFYKEDTLSPTASKALAKSCLALSEDGTQLSYREILAFASRHLTPEGTLSLILPYSERKAVIAEASRHNLKIFRILSIRTTPTKPFSRIIVEFARYDALREPLSEENLTIYTSNSTRTPEFQTLTGEYYLELRNHSPMNLS